MYYDDCTYHRGNHTYRRDLLRESRRVHGKVVKQTIANITDWPAPVKRAIRAALAAERQRGGRPPPPGARRLAAALAAHAGAVLHQGPSLGAVATVLALTRTLGLAAALGDDRAGRLGLFQVLARVIDQGSRLGAVRWAKSHLGAELLGLDHFDEDDLYTNLGELCARQRAIEDALFAQRYGGGRRPALFLYDVTSSYFEGTENALAAFGYNRDGKRGKKQVVVGLLTDQDGVPLSIELFPGNTADPATVAAQVAKLRTRFGGGALTLVGDRGMLRQPQQQALTAAGMHYLTAITEPQIAALLRREVLQLELFEEAIGEVVVAERGVRYVLRHNPEQATRDRARRADQLATWERAVTAANSYLAEHPRATVAAAVRRLTARAARLQLSAWVRLEVADRTLRVVVDAAARAHAARLDGCYVLQTDLPVAAADKATLDARYHDLSRVEWAFRTCKTTHLELRPIYLRRADHTRGHALVVMLSYLVERQLATRWAALDLTVREGLTDLAQYCVIEAHLPDGTVVRELPAPRATTAALLAAAQIELPTVLPPKAAVDTTRKLPARRKVR